MKLSLKRSDKLRLKSDFDKVWETGRRLRSEHCLIVAAPAAPGRGVRCGVVCGKKYSLKAVARNRAKRLIRESFRLLKASLEPRDIVVLAQRDMTDMSMPEIRGELAAVFRKAGIFKL